MAQIAWLRPSTQGEHVTTRRACHLKTPLTTRLSAVMAIQWLVHACTMPPVRNTSYSCGTTDTAPTNRPAIQSVSKTGRLFMSACTSAASARAPGSMCTTGSESASVWYKPRCTTTTRCWSHSTIAKEHTSASW